MPTTRRSTRSSTGAGKQQTLSFKHKVTKAIKTGKEGYKSPARAKEYIPEPTPEPTTKQDDDEETHTPATSENEHEHEHEHEQPAPQTTVAEPTAKPDEATQAAQITDRAIERSWAGIEASRSAKAVHKKHGEGLTTGEKVLRYFDVSSQYGVRIVFLPAS
jgi:DNA polymerase delta subunit 4